MLRLSLDDGDTLGEGETEGDSLALGLVLSLGDREGEIDEDGD